MVIPHNTVILNDMMEVSPSDIPKQLKHWSKKEGEGNAVLDAYAFHALLAISDTDVGMDCLMNYWLMLSAPLWHL